jgi:hypothetical protein
VLRKNDHNITQQSLFMVATGKKNRGRPKETLRITIGRKSKSMNFKNFKELKDVAIHRPNWRAMVSALCAAYGPGEL